MSMIMNCTNQEVVIQMTLLIPVILKSAISLVGFEPTSLWLQVLLSNRWTTVSLVGFEPTSLWLQVLLSNHWTTVSLVGFEPTFLWLQVLLSNHWTTVTVTRLQFTFPIRCAYNIAAFVCRHTIHLLHAVTGSMAFCTLEGENGTRGEAEGAIYPRGCKKPWTPVTACNNRFVIPLYNCYFSSRSSVVIFKHYYDGLFVV